MAPVDLRNPGRPLQVGIILVKDTTEILDVAPIDLLSAMSKSFIDDFPDDIMPPSLKSQALDIVWHWVNQDGTPAALTCGVSANITDTFETCPPLDIAIMGANSFSYEPSQEELAFVRKTYDDCSAFLTICGGFMVPMKAGLFAGKTATAPKMVLPMVRAQTEKMPKEMRTTWTEERWHVSEDGKMWSSGALLNGLDMMREFGRRTWGGEGSLVEASLEMGGWPVRSREY
ncbi:hypothetical protein H2198_010419 [Neophaeococcomyces mojaviensis]|uniref:Uncharacterized protein n=1 Tax=Neophaeococcomyces mojaviensis TaxID=3383035 RepID=A0ACC2ZRK4_9EURO|nr:hypothetical protein H2198_010419 [Knufia sp. JES_112]